MKQIFADKAPAAIGPYCHAIVHGDLVFCSGQIPLDPETMEIVGTNIEDQTARVMKNIEIVLSKVGTTLNKIVKATIF
ncbi:MAG: reactive intermediate/imine deaminase, partial [Desulfobacula sp.]|nr:reactive intermediate/imine deaminase [Desulfobacula sp.]